MTRASHLHSAGAGVIVRGSLLFATPDMGCLPFVGPLKVYVSFAEYIFFNKALLQKRPVILRSLLIVGTP